MQSKSTCTMAGLLIGFFLCGAAWAADLAISPLRLSFQGSNRTETVVVKNHGDRPATVQIQAFLWDQDEGRVDAYVPTRDIVFFPRIFSIAPGKEQVVRVGTLFPPETTEASYRLYFEELPDAGTTQGLAVTTRVRMGIPVFIIPPEELPRLALEQVQTKGESVGFTLRNTGNVHVIVKSAQLVLSGPQESPLTVPLESVRKWYVLAGTSEQITQHLDPGLCFRRNTLQVRIETDRGTFAETLHCEK